jgi:DNA-binding NarL/FixJ family response regulator
MAFMTKTTVLLADDHALVRAGIHNALKEMPDLEIVGEVGDGRSLQTALAQKQPDCLLIDVTMPHFDPIAAIRHFRSQYPDMKILVVSAYDDDVYVQGLLGVGVHGYHLKDQPLSDLRLAVRRVLDNQRWISSSLLDKLLHPSAQLSANAPAFSSRQRDILHLLVQGLDNRAMAQRLGLSVKTIENHLTRLYRQLNVQSRLEAANYVRDHAEIMGQTGPLPIPEPLPVPQPQHEQVAILLVDDNKRYRTQLCRTISKVMPHAVIYEAGSTAESLQLLRQITPQLTFVDVVLGDEDGIRCMRQIKENVPACRLILISAYPDREFHRRGLEAGATAFLDKKDLDAPTLQQIIEDAIG